MEEEELPVHEFVSDISPPKKIKTQYHTLDDTVSLSLICFISTTKRLSLPHLNPV